MPFVLYFYPSPNQINDPHFLPFAFARTGVWIIYILTDVCFFILCFSFSILIVLSLVSLLTCWNLLYFLPFCVWLTKNRLVSRLLEHGITDKRSARVWTSQTYCTKRLTGRRCFLCVYKPCHSLFVETWEDILYHCLSCIYKLCLLSWRLACDTFFSVSLY